jgi:transcriptional regulator ATRX
VQAIARIFRYGQTRQTYIYSLVYQGTMEEACYRRNVDKEGLSKKVVDQRTVKGGHLVCSSEASYAMQSHT